MAAPPSRQDRRRLNGGRETDVSHLGVFLERSQRSVMRLVLKELYFEDMSHVRRGLEFMGPRQFMFVFGVIELEIDSRTLNLADSSGIGVPIQAFCSNVKGLRDWLSIPRRVRERKFTTHAIGGYFLRFRLSGENVAVMVRKNVTRDAEEVSETLSAEAAQDALRAFRRELRTRMLKEAPTEAAEYFWKVSFAANINEDPYS